MATTTASSTIRWTAREIGSGAAEGTELGRIWPSLRHGREELRKELLAEAYALHEVYCGIHGAAVALAGHEETIRQYYGDHPRADYAASARPTLSLSLRPPDRNLLPPSRRRSRRVRALARSPGDQEPARRARPGEGHSRPPRRKAAELEPGS